MRKTYNIVLVQYWVCWRNWQVCPKLIDISFLWCNVGADISLEKRDGSEQVEDYRLPGLWKPFSSSSSKGQMQMCTTKSCTPFITLGKMTNPISEVGHVLPHRAQRTTTTGCHRTPWSIRPSCGWPRYSMAFSKLLRSSDHASGHGALADPHWHDTLASGLPCGSRDSTAAAQQEPCIAWRHLLKIWPDQECSLNLGLPSSTGVPCH